MFIAAVVLIKKRNRNPTVKFLLCAVIDTPIEQNYVTEMKSYDPQFLIERDGRLQYITGEA